MFWKNYVELCNRINKSPNAVAKELKIASGTVTNWKNGIIPSDKKAFIIADYFGVSVDYLLGREDAPPQAPSDYAKLNELGKQKADEYISLLLSNPEYTEQQFAKDVANEIKSSLSTPKLKN